MPLLHFEKCEAETTIQDWLVFNKHAAPVIVLHGIAHVGGDDESVSFQVNLV